MYAFEQLDGSDNPAVIFRGIVGSRAYGTATPESDTDLRGVFVVPSAEYVSLMPPPKQVADAKNDRTYYSLLRFCELASEANPTTLEMLYLPDDCILKATTAFNLLRAERGLFITRRAVDSHLGYAVSQIKKARGCNKRVWNPWPEEPPLPEDYCVFIADARKRPQQLREAGVDLIRCKAAPVAKSVSSDILAVYDYGEDVGGVFRDGMPVVSDIPKADSSRRIGILIFGRQAFDSAKRQRRFLEVFDSVQPYQCVVPWDPDGDGVADNEDLARKADTEVAWLCHFPRPGQDFVGELQVHQLHALDLIAQAAGFLELQVGGGLAHAAFQVAQGGL